MEVALGRAGWLGKPPGGDAGPAGKGGAVHDRASAGSGVDPHHRLSAGEAAGRRGLSRSAGGAGMMRAVRTIFGALLIAICAIAFAPSAQAAGPTCNGKFVNPITDVCWSCLFPLSVGGLTIWPSGRPDTNKIGRASGRERVSKYVK